MVKKKKFNIEKIKKLLTNQPFEDVYSNFFAGEVLDSESFLAFELAFNNEGFENDRIKFLKLKLLTEWINQNLDERILDFFPNFIEFYISIMYRKNGLRAYSDSSGSVIAISREPDALSYSQVVILYEQNLIQKTWWSELDSVLWMEFKKKRKEVEDFEEYIYKLEEDITRNLHSEEESEIGVQLPLIYTKHINKVRLKIAEMKLFNGDPMKVQILENLINYIDALAKDETHYLSVINKEENNQTKAEQTLKLNLLHQFGIIKFLNEVWLRYNIARPMEHLLATLMNENHKSIQPRLSDRNHKKLINDTSLEKLEKYLKDFGMEPNQMYEN